MVERGIREREDVELEQHILGVKREIYETVSERSPEKIRELISNVRDRIREEKEKGKGRLKELKKISEIEEGPYGSEYFVDGKVAYLPRRGKGIFVGDIHADPEAIISAVEQSGFVEDMEGGNKEKVLIFKGDYANRGEDSIGALNLVLKLKEKYPDNVILLRGNHEGLDQSMMGVIYKQNCLFKSVRDEIYPGRDYEKNKKSIELVSEYNNLFEDLPGVVFTANGITAVHGGIPNERVGNLQQLNDEEKLKQMRWNDPNLDHGRMVPNVDRDPEGKEDYVEFGEESFTEFMDDVGAHVMIRSHEPRENGKIIFNNRLATVFSSGGDKSSSSYYKDAVKAPKIVIVSLEKDKDSWEESDFVDLEYVKPNL